MPAESITVARIRDLAARISQGFRPERIVLFGSFAYGVPTPDSDVDLLVVMAHADKAWREAAAIRTTVKPDFPVDILVRSPGEIAERLALGGGFIQEILSRGKVLYEAAHR
jgi:predicted nucleotidyltransferase